MTIRILGQLPGSQLHIGAQLALPELRAALENAQNARAVIEAQRDAIFNLDIEPAELTAALDFDTTALADLAASISLGKASATAAISADIAALLATSQRLEGIAATLSAALDGAVEVYVYSGDATGLGLTLGQETDSGIGAGSAGETINSLVLATSSADEWATLSLTLNAPAPPIVTTARPRALKVLGSVPGTALHVAVALAAPLLLSQATLDVVAKLSVFQMALLQLQLVVPSDPLQLAAGIAAAASGASNIAAQMPTLGVTANLNLSTELLLQIGIAATLEPVVARLELGLQGDGVIGYHYHGRADRLASELGALTRRGVAGGNPGDEVNALVLATGDQVAWNKLGKLLKTV